MSRRPGSRPATASEIAAMERECAERGIPGPGSITAGDGATPASPPLQSAEDRAFMRLELLRLAHRHDHTEQQIVERCKALEAYVFDDQPADKF